MSQLITRNNRPDLMQTVFVHTNAKQMLGAIVSAHSLKRNSRSPNSFAVSILNKEEHTFFKEFEGKKFLRAGKWRKWENGDLQSFTPTRFMVPELMGYQERAVVIDPDVFAVGDVAELFSKDMQEAAVMAKHRPGHNKLANYVASSVMLLDCAKLKHWKVKEQFASMFEGKLDYEDWNTLQREPEGSVKFLDSVWNDFDNLNRNTKLLHNTKRNTQPWKTGLPIDYMNRLPGFLAWLPVSGFKMKGNYRKHPDLLQEELFFSMLRECLDLKLVDDAMLRDEIAQKHIRDDAQVLLEKARPVSAVLADVQNRAA
jgi:hypothetical protein